MLANSFCRAIDAANTTVATAPGQTAVMEDEAVAAANANGTTYNLAALLASNTNALDLVTLDNSVLTNIANAGLSAATDGTELLKALVAAGAGNTAASITLGNVGDQLYILTDDGTNGCLYHANSGTDNVILASEINLVATFTGSQVGDIVAGQTTML